MNWSSSTVEDVLHELKVTPEGLSEEEAANRLKTYGPNVLKQINSNPWWKLALSQFTNVMVLILIAAALVSGFIGEIVDATAIGVIIVLNAIIGFAQEYRAERAVEALKKMAAPSAIVIRGGEAKQISAKDLVPGDILVLDEGSHIPADARLIQSVHLSGIEASLTGESNAIPKQTEPIQKAHSLGDLSNMVFMGTLVSQGHGKAVVVATGMQTEFGKIAHLVQTEQHGKTPLQKHLDQIGKTLAIIVVCVAAVLFAVSFLQGKDPVETFLLSVSLIVSAIPEGLPAVITLTLALGVQQMAKHRAIIRKLPAAETLGSTTVICSDKTGTLTQNQMTVQVIQVNGDRIEVSGIGYKPEGNIPVMSAELTRLLHIGMLCNNARLIQSGDQWTISGDPTEACLLTLGAKAGLKRADLEKEFPRSDELIFDSERKRMSTVNGHFLFTKGAPESVLEVCTHIQEDGEIRKLTDAKKKEILAANAELAKQAYRVLGFAYKENATKEEGLIFVGMVGIIDPARPEVKVAIQTAHQAHIKVVMITGDHALTAQAIGREIGLYKDGDELVTGEELDSMSDAELDKFIQKVRIFARVNPSHKVRILKAFQKQGEIVAMTGDGVNDAPALKSADIGIAMGITGTDVSKEASEMILLDDNFATIVKSVESGRVIYKNIKKFIRFLLSANFGEVLVVSSIFMFGFPSPLIPLQILWINLLTDALPAIALGLDPAPDGIMTLKPRDTKRSIWSELLYSAAVGGVLCTTVCVALFFFYESTETIEKTRTVVFTGMVLFELMLVFSIRNEKANYFKDFFKNPILLVSVLASFGLQLLAIYWPTLQPILQTTALTMDDWKMIVGMCILGVILMEFWKFSQPKPDHV